MLKHNSIIEAEVVKIRADCMAAYSVEFESRPSELESALATMEEALKFPNNGHISERTAVEFIASPSLELEEYSRQERHVR